MLSWGRNRCRSPAGLCNVFCSNTPSSRTDWPGHKAGGRSIDATTPRRRTLRAKNSTESVRKRQKVVFFGHFGSDNFGNEGTLQAIYFNLRRLMPEAEFACVCTLPETAATMHSITTSPISPPVVTAWTPNSRVTRLLRSVALGIPSELYRWYAAFGTLKGTDTLIVPGTGLLTDAFGLLSWGPYNIFKWSVLAKLRGCRLLFVSVGAGPLHGRLGRFFVKSALALADYRSYRDNSSLEYLKEIGFTPSNDRVCPDLAFSLPESLIPPVGRVRGGRPVVGLGLMNSGAMYSDSTLSRETYRSYMESLVSLATWLLDRGYDVRLLIGELGDPVSEFRRLLAERLPAYDPSRVTRDSSDLCSGITVTICRYRFCRGDQISQCAICLAKQKTYGFDRVSPQVHLADEGDRVV